MKPSFTFGKYFSGDKVLNTLGEDKYIGLMKSRRDWPQFCPLTLLMLKIDACANIANTMMYIKLVTLLVHNLIVKYVH